eukprot:scaffold249497_cov18-Tisochrysis_lutea.AAC.1
MAFHKHPQEEALGECNCLCLQQPALCKSSTDQLFHWQHGVVIKGVRSSPPGAHRACKRPHRALSKHTVIASEPTGFIKLARRQAKVGQIWPLLGKAASCRYAHKCYTCRKMKKISNLDVLRCKLGAPPSDIKNTFHSQSALKFIDDHKNHRILTTSQRYDKQCTH